MNAPELESNAKPRSHAADSDEPGDDWVCDLIDALREVVPHHGPMMERRILRDRARAYARQAARMPARYLVLAFGSLARCEAAEDLDLIFACGNAARGHKYWRITGERRHVDANVVSESWLREAWCDVEYGYWLNESYVLDANDTALVSTWKRSCNLYWSPAALSRRAHAHRAMTFELLAAQAHACDGGLSLLSRFLGHEAARAAGCALIDRYGSRVFSHRTFIAEFSTAAREAALPAPAISALLWGLTGDANDAESRFLRLRRSVSQLLRVSNVSAAIGFDPAHSRMGRVEALCRPAYASSGAGFEDGLYRAGLDGVLPTTRQLSGLRTAAETLLQRVSPPRPVPLLQALALPVTLTPTFGDVRGARWVSCEDGRLKIIVNTGGCKTASCAFCALPAFGRSAARANVAKTLNAALQRHHPREVALYNDGNLLNPREVAATDLHKACEVIRQHRIEGLSIESLPRFVTRDIVADVRTRSGVGRLIVALGLQGIGNAFSVGRLGRPDTDALFDFAIDEVHDAGAEVRLYLLWGYGSIALESWGDCLARSMAWAQARGVETLSVCPYASPIDGRPSYDGATSLDELRRIVRPFQTVPGTRVEIVETGLASCALRGRSRMRS